MKNDMTDKVFVRRISYYEGVMIDDKVKIHCYLSQKRISDILGKNFDKRGIIEDIYSKELAMKLGKPIIVMKSQFVEKHRSEECIKITLPDRTLLPCSQFIDK